MNYKLRQVLYFDQACYITHLYYNLYSSFAKTKESVTPGSIMPLLAGSFYLC